MASICQAKAEASLLIEQRRQNSKRARVQLNLDQVVLKMRDVTKSIQEKREKKRIIFLENPPPIPTINSTKCKARTLDNKPCPFRATCGQFCTRHKV
jgi:hypothetical protein